MKYEITIKTKEGIYKFNNEELEDLASIVEQHQEYEEIEIKREDKKIGG